MNLYLCRPAYFVRNTQLLPRPGHGCSGRFTYHVIQRNETTNDSFFRVRWHAGSLFQDARFCSHFVLG